MSWCGLFCGGEINGYIKGGGNCIEVKHRFLMSQTGCFVPCLSLISISSYVEQGTKETGNIYAPCKKVFQFCQKVKELLSF